MDSGVQFLVLAVRFRNHSCHLSARADSQHSDKKLLMNCLWCSALPGIAPSVTANQHPKYKLAGRIESSTGESDVWPQALHFQPHVGGNQTWCDDYKTKFKLRPLPLISEWQMVNPLHESKLMRKHNGGSLGPDPHHNKRLLVKCELLCDFRLSEKNNQSRYAEDKQFTAQFTAIVKWLSVD